MTFIRLAAVAVAATLALPLGARAESQPLTCHDYAAMRASGMDQDLVLFTARLWRAYNVELAKEGHGILFYPADAEVLLNALSKSCVDKPDNMIAERLASMMFLITTIHEAQIAQLRAGHGAAQH